MENTKTNKSEHYYNNFIPSKSIEQCSLALTSEASTNQYLAAQQHLETQKQFYGHLNITKSTSKAPQYYQKSHQDFTIPPSTSSIPLPSNSSSLFITQSVPNNTKSGHSHADVFPIGDELNDLLTIQRDSDKQTESIKNVQSFPYELNNNMFFKYQNDSEIESLLNDQNYLGFNLMTSNPQWQSNELMTSSTQPSDPKEQEQENPNKDKRNESDVFNELLSLAQNRTHTTHVQTSPLEYNKQMTTNRDITDFMPEDIDQRHSQYSEYYIHGMPNFQKHKRNFKLEVLQQPARARMCGYGNKDRRPITPPPIIKLIVTSDDGYLIDPESFDTSFIILVCDSCQQHIEQNIETNETSPQLVTFSSNKEPSAVKMRNLVGSSVSSATKLYDLDGNLGIFFIFQDISLRTEGHFRLKLSLVDIGSQYSHTVNTTSVSQVISTAYTDIFTVYTAKNFPGVVESTPLTQCFSRQGIKIPFRRDIGKKNTQKKDTVSKEAK